MEPSKAPAEDFFAGVAVVGSRSVDRTGRLRRKIHNHKEGSDTDSPQRRPVNASREILSDRPVLLDRLG